MNPRPSSLLARTAATLLAGAAFLCGCSSPPPVSIEADAAWVRQVFGQPHDPNRLMETYLLASGDQLSLRLRVEPLTEPPPAASPVFLLQPGHRVSIRFVHANGLDVTQTIRPDGWVSLPYVGEVRAAGQTVAAWTQHLKALYAEHLRAPELYVLVEDPAVPGAAAEDPEALLRGETTEVLVRPDGFASFPLLEDMEAAGRSVPELSRMLALAYRDRDPRIRADLSLAQPAGLFVYVLGQVAKPGAIQMTRPITVLEALSLVGSSTASAQLNQVIVLRKRGDAVAARRLNLADLGAGGFAPFYLGPDDMVYVPKSSIYRTAELTRVLADVLLFRGWSANIRWEDLYE